MTGVVTSMPVFIRHLPMFTSISRQNHTVGTEENLLDIQVSTCYVLKYLEDRQA